MTDIRLRPLCANGLAGQPECRSLIQAMIDLGWDMERRLQFLTEVERMKDVAVEEARAAINSHQRGISYAEFRERVRQMRRGT